MPHIESHNKDIFQQRRNILINLIREKYSDAPSGIILLFSDFEKERAPFRQESSFYYLTGIKEPASALAIDLANEQSVLFVPNFGAEREKWMAQAIVPEKEFENKFGVDSIKYLGQPCKGYQCHPFFSQREYANLLEFLDSCVKEKKPIYTLNPSNAHAYIEQRFILQRIAPIIPGFKELLVDISPIVEQMRRIKETKEIEMIYKAIDITIDAHFVLAREIRSEIIEYELEGLINYMFIGKGGTVAFPSIVASGKNSTVLHYHNNNNELAEGQLVVVDIGAEYNHYCADLTRTYPVSGKFTDRQREVYMMVLETQEYIASIAKPGYWLSNKEQPDKSLHHLAVEFLKQKGYAQYFTHGIGHFLGLEVHDVGDYTKPLQMGDVITIEPGIYIPQEQLGVRIEDDYWVVEDGVVCLSEELPKSPEDIEKMITEDEEED